MSRITWGHDALRLTFAAPPDGPVSLARAETPHAAVASAEPVGVVQVQTAGSGHKPAGARLGMTTLGEELRHVAHEASTEDGWHRLAVDLAAPGIAVRLLLESPDGVPAFRSSVRVTAAGDGPVVLRAVSSWAAPLGVADDGAGWWLHTADSDWIAESRWRRRAFRPELFPEMAAHLMGLRPRGEVRLVSPSTWSSGRHVPVAAAEGPDACWLWQVEHNGAWRIEVGEEFDDFSVALGGPNDLDHSWMVALAPGESFESVPVGVALGRDLDGAASAATRYRRAARHPHPDNAARAIVFNDYMNTLNGDPTTEKLLPLIDAAAATGAEIFCIDAGWYDETGHWWDSVGEWLPSRTRFPGGLGEVVDHIRARGMTPGLWLEPEVVGVRSPMADLLPDGAFMMRGGQRLVEDNRFHLDLRHPAAREHLDSVVDRLVDEFGVGYFKFDYNTTPAAGTDHDSPSVGHGLLEHNRAHLAWLEGLFERHPGLVIENCGSGGMRADFAMLQRLQLQSTSDQQDPLLYPPIAASAPLQMLPEQAASWAYPQAEMTDEEAAFCLVTGLAGRFYLSGFLNRMSEDRLALVREAVAVAKDLRAGSPVPRWPLGLPGWTDDVLVLGLDGGDDMVLAVWQRGDGGDVALPLPELTGREIAVETVFPARLDEWPARWDADAGELHLATPAGPAARLIRVTLV